MKWNDDHLLGLASMDDTHEEFVACVDAMLTAPDVEVRDRLDTLADHLQRHFGQEDEWMIETAFPPRECHIDEHAAVMRSVREVQALLASPAEGQDMFALARSLAAALADWFEGHTTHLDSALAHWMCKRQHGGKPVVLRLRRASARGPRSARCAKVDSPFPTPLRSAWRTASPSPNSSNELSAGAKWAPKVSLD